VYVFLLVLSALPPSDNSITFSDDDYDDDNNNINAWTMAAELRCKTVGY
jgi:hypothetical protein